MVMSKKIGKKKKNLYPKCDWRYCRNNGTLFPILLMPAPKWAEQKDIEMEMSLNVCVVHADENKLDLFLDDRGWFQVQQALALRKLAIPDRSQVRLIFKALEDRKIQA
jgi:hypothetical protein